MKFLYDFFPVLLFYVAYQFYDIFVATGVFIAASFVQISYSWLRHRKVEKLHLITFLLVLVFGGLTIVLQDSQFIQWKVSIVNWLFGIVFLASEFIGERNIVRRMMDKVIDMPDPIWTRLNASWALFFIGMGFLNLYVMYNFSEATWVNFKVYGLLGLTFAFVIAQSFYLARHATEQVKEEGEVE